MSKTSTIIFSLSRYTLKQKTISVFFSFFSTNKSNDKQKVYFIKTILHCHSLSVYRNAYSLIHIMNVFKALPNFVFRLRDQNQAHSKIGYYNGKIQGNTRHRLLYFYSSNHPKNRFQKQKTISYIKSFFEPIDQYVVHWFDNGLKYQGNGMLERERKKTISFSRLDQKKGSGRGTVY